MFKFRNYNICNPISYHIYKYILKLKTKKIKLSISIYFVNSRYPLALINLEDLFLKIIYLKKQWQKK